VRRQLQSSNKAEPLRNPSERVIIHSAFNVCRWTPNVVQDEQFCILARFLDLKPRWLSHFQEFRLARSQIRLHWKIRPRKVERVFVILTHGGAARLTFVTGQINEMAGSLHARSTAGPASSSKCLTTNTSSCAVFFE